MRKKKIPWEDDEFVYFELKSPKVRVFDLPFEGVTYEIPNFKPGLYRLPIREIRKAPDEMVDAPAYKNAIAVDMAMMFFVDDRYAEEWQNTVDHSEMLPPDEQYCEEISKEVGVRFGYCLAPGVDSGFEFEGDGCFVIDPDKFERVE